MFELHGYGPLGIAAAGAQTATVRDGAATFYNPAQLAARKQTSVSVSTYGLVPNLHIDRAPDARTDADGGRTERTPESNVGASVSASFALGALWGRPVAVGVGVFVPLQHFTRLDAIDPATPQFALHQQAPTRLAIVFGGGYEPLDGVRVGAGVQVLAALDGRAAFVLDTEGRRVVRRTVDTSLDTASAPILSLAWSPIDALELGLTWRGAIEIEYTLPIDIIFEDAGTVEIDIDGTSLYTPASLTAGAGLHVADWTFAFDLQWMRWSRTPPLAAHFAATVQLPELDPDGDAEASALRFVTVDTAPGWRDILVPRVSARWESDGDWAPGATFGYAYKPSPVPTQVGYTSYLDSDTHQLGAGADIGLRQHRLHLTTGLSILTERVSTKDPERDIVGVGDLSSGGTIWTIVFGYSKLY